MRPGPFLLARPGHRRRFSEVGVVGRRAEASLHQEAEREVEEDPGGEGAL